MSASQEKRNRNPVHESSVSSHGPLTQEEEEALKFRRNTIIVIVTVAVLVIFSAIVNSNLLYRATTAVSSGGTNYSPAQVDVFYRQAQNGIYSSYQQMFGDSASYFLNSLTSETVWPEAERNIQEITALYDDAKKNGMSLTADDSAEIDEQIATLSETAISYGYSSLEHFLSSNYGKGVNESILRDILERMYVAQNYAEEKQDSFSYEQSDLDAYYEGHKDELDVFSYYAYTISTSNAAFDELEDDEAKAAAAHDAAQAIADAAAESGVEGFTDAVHAFSESASVTESNSAGSSVSSNYQEWMTDSAREVGDATVIDTDTGSVALLYMGRDDGSYPLVSMRHILISLEPDEDGEYLEEDKNEAENEIYRIYDEWLEDPTEEHFAELADQYSTDSGSNTNGGLYEDIYKHQMVPEIDSFLFDEDAEAGDSKVVYVESTNYRGWHIVYFMGPTSDALYRNSTVENLLRNDDFTAWEDALIEKYAVVQKSGFRYVNMD